MELTQEQKNKIIEVKLRRYESIMFELELDITALRANNDEDGIKPYEQRLKSLRTAYDAVNALRVGEGNANS